MDIAKIKRPSKDLVEKGSRSRRGHGQRHAGAYGHPQLLHGRAGGANAGRRLSPGPASRCR